MRTPPFLLALLLPLGSPAAQPAAEENLAVNGGFEEIGPTLEAPAVGWSGFWSRDEGEGSIVLDESAKHSGDQSLKAVHTGARDWSVSQEGRIPVRPRDIFRLSGWVKCEGVERDVTLSVIPYDEQGKVLSWSWGAVSSSGTHAFERVESRFAVPSNCHEVTLRLTGFGPGTAWLDDVKLVREGNLTDLLGKALAKQITIRNQAIILALDTRTGALTVRDTRAGYAWRQLPHGAGLVIRSAERPQ